LIDKQLSESQNDFFFLKVKKKNANFGYTTSNKFLGVNDMRIDGSIISGEFDETSNEYYLKRVKNHSTTSTINKNQCINLYNYLKAHADDEDGQIITLYDQMLVPLSQDEIKEFMNDLERVESIYH
jgi:hypothetical protein